MPSQKIADKKLIASDEFSNLWCQSGISSLIIRGLSPIVRKFILMFFVFATIGSFSNCYAAILTAKEEYELQERCGNRVEKWFKDEYGNGVSDTKEGQAISAYTNHYNKKLNKCFIVLSYQTMPYKVKGNMGSLSYDLFDINEQKGYGKYFKRFQDATPSECKVGDEVCHSETEWEALIKPYMND